MPEVTLHVLDAMDPDIMVGKMRLGWIVESLKNNQHLHFIMSNLPNRGIAGGVNKYVTLTVIVVVAAVFAILVSLELTVENSLALHANKYAEYADGCAENEKYIVTDNQKSKWEQNESDIASIDIEIKKIKNILKNEDNCNLYGSKRNIITLKQDRARLVANQAKIDFIITKSTNTRKKLCYSYNRVPVPEEIIKSIKDTNNRFHDSKLAYSAAKAEYAHDIKTIDTYFFVFRKFKKVANFSKQHNQYGVNGNDQHAFCMNVMSAYGTMKEDLKLSDFAWIGNCIVAKEENMKHFDGKQDDNRWVWAMKIFSKSDATYHTIISAMTNIETISNQIDIINSVIFTHEDVKKIYASYQSVDFQYHHANARVKEIHAMFLDVAVESNIPTRLSVLDMRQVTKKIMISRRLMSN